MNFAIKFLNEVKIFFHDISRSKLVLHSVMSLRQRGPLVWELASHAGGGYSVGSNLGVRVAIFVFFAHFFFCLFVVFLLIFFIACVASVSAWFRSKKRPRNDARNKILGFRRAGNETSAK